MLTRAGALTLPAPGRWTSTPHSHRRDQYLCAGDFLDVLAFARIERSSTRVVGHTGDLLLKGVHHASMISSAGGTLTGSAGCLTYC